MPIKPLLHRVLVKPDTLDVDPAFAAAKRAGLVMPEHSAVKMEENRVDTGTVIDIGSTAFKAYMKEGDLEEVPVKIGDRISFAKYAGKVIMQGETKFIVLNDEDIVAVMGDHNV